jgi:hypothetical protein
VHFIDGAQGGYAAAASTMKAKSAGFSHSQPARG